MENASLRTNWIISIEKLLNIFNLTELPNTHLKFKIRTKRTISEQYINFWDDYKRRRKNSRMEFYDEIKSSFSFENYLDLPIFFHRKTITKIRCSDHTLEIEKGRHKKTPREQRLCKLCDSAEVETEEHFLCKCNFFNELKRKHKVMQFSDAVSFINGISPASLGIYLTEALSKRNETVAYIFEVSKSN